MKTKSISGLSRSIIIPAYNEEHRIKNILPKYCRYFPDNEILVVCNGCSDNTPDVIREVSQEYPQVKLLVFDERLGKGGAIKKGFEVASGDQIGFIDADESVEPEEVEKLFNALYNSDAVIGSRWLKGSVIPIKQPLWRRIFSRAFNLFIRIIFSLPFSDTQCGAKFLNREVVKNISHEMQTQGFEFDVELLWRIKGNGYVIKEIPITWKHSKGSHFSLLCAPSIFLSLLRLRFNL